MILYNIFLSPSFYSTCTTKKRQHNYFDCIVLIFPLNYLFSNFSLFIIRYNYKSLLFPQTVFLIKKCFLRHIIFTIRTNLSASFLIFLRTLQHPNRHPEMVDIMQSQRQKDIATSSATGPGRSIGRTKNTEQKVQSRKSKG